MPYRILLSLSTAGIVVLLWLTPVPLGVPGEWTWNRHAYSTDEFWWLAVDLMVAAAVAAAYLGFASWLSKRINQIGVGKVAGALVLLVGLAWLWIVAVQRCTPTSHAALKPTWVLYDPGSSGYFFEARSIRHDAREFLGGYEARMAQGDVLHEGTHPPGLYLMHAGLINLCEAWPRLEHFLWGVFPADKISAFRQLEHHARLGPRLSQTELASLWLASLLTEFAAVLTIVPLFVLLCRWTDRTSAWNAVVWWPLIPAIAVFLPKSDALYPVIAVLLLLLSDCGLTARSRFRRGSASLAAGLVLFLGMMLTLAFLPVAAAATAFAVRNCRVNRTRPLEIAVVCGLAGIGFTVPIIALALSCDLDMLAVWRWNLSNHSNFYSRFSRTYWRWLLVNIPETLIAVGLPLILHAVATCRARSANMINDNPPTAAWRSQFVFAAVWLLLWLSGKNSGEAGRLWILLMPWVVLASGHGGGTASRFGMVIQAIFCLAVASRVSGFQFTG